MNTFFKLMLFITTPFYLCNALTFQDLVTLNDYRVLASTIIATKTLDLSDLEISNWTGFSTCLALINNGQLIQTVILDNNTLTAANGGQTVLNTIVNIFTKTTTLHLVRCGLNANGITLPSLASLPLLTDLDVSYNTLIAGDLANIGSLRTITALRLKNCAINETAGALPTTFFTNKPLLTLLDLSFNPITTTNLLSISALLKLTSLSLEACEISTYFALPNTTQLKSLNLTNNPRLPSSMINQLPQATALTTLKIAGCGIASFPSNFFTALSNLTVFDVSNNPLSASTLAAQFTSTVQRFLTLNQSNFIAYGSTPLTIPVSSFITLAQPPTC